MLRHGHDFEQFRDTSWAGLHYQVQWWCEMIFNIFNFITFAFFGDRCCKKTSNLLGWSDRQVMPQKFYVVHRIATEYFDARLDNSATKLFGKSELLGARHWLRSQRAFLWICSGRQWLQWLGMLRCKWISLWSAMNKYANYWRHLIWKISADRLEINQCFWIWCFSLHFIKWCDAWVMKCVTISIHQNNFY